ncbi:uncharacterized protein LOC123007196 isoform X2 [Tribolium madens]|uniref:uncharacterized protein LOC123007196 isoform X2 n=1 Tax=Tribolium madens TaxID=41895 RepID=UPI001CF75DAF|nr:uncharacterized protein LOC123007196 isoform X2 [Tribolium madens]
MAVIVILALFLTVASRQSFVDTAPLNEGTPGDSTSTQDSSVRELESLKHSIGKTLEMIKTQSSVYTNNNGQKQAHAERKEQVNENGKLVSKIDQHIDIEGKESARPQGKIQTEIDVPAKGIHKSVVQQLPEYQTLTENGNRRSEGLSETGNGIDKFNAFSGIQYSPLDMAEYVFWTGDEKGVTLAIEEFLQEGLMTREEAISFLQEIKYNLDYLKNHYTQLGLNAKERSRTQDTQLKYSGYAQNDKPELKSSFDLNQLRQEATKKREPEVPHSIPMMKSNGEKSQDEDYDELLERLRVADFLYTEYSLEEVIYQLAKVMFTQSLTRGSAEAQQALQKFTNFLEIEAEQGHISRTLEKKVLDVLIASLSDTLTEHPELLSATRESLGATSTNADGQHFLRQILEISPDDKAAVRAYKGQTERNIPVQKITNHVPLGLGKYKNP